MFYYSAIVARILLQQSQKKTAAVIAVWFSVFSFRFSEIAGRSLSEN
jgi:hypothetical protein